MNDGELEQARIDALGAVLEFGMQSLETSKDAAFALAAPLEKIPGDGDAEVGAMGFRSGLLE
eukprot:CAMPEP_0179000942 /NCGR_PEP_ID=MMETSP0795-20121207/11009_1 /TAXON_ID=88552 /ORGANISM="Amoebophrya sp., Strain Ameob2" /LENGTH=61 /DNA_ID=CAMNT_0020694109 /DNA_START=39 /DNA_END=225 /DNA_ORIENTATION=+